MAPSKTVAAAAVGDNTALVVGGAPDLDTSAYTAPRTGKEGAVGTGAGWKRAEACRCSI